MKEELQMRSRFVASGAVLLVAVFVFFLASSAISTERSKLLLSLVQTVIWPVLILIIILTFRDTIRGPLSGADKLTLKAGATGVEATVERQQIEAAPSSAATGKQSQTTDGQTADVNQARSIAKVVSNTVQPSTVVRLSGKSILWVDDNPSNNLYERSALEALGIQIVLSKSTEDALQQLQNGRFDVVISDMGRPLDARAGYTLLDKMRQLGVNTPYIIYAGSNSPEHNREAQVHGAIGSTNNPEELFALVLGAIQNSAK